MAFRREQGISRNAPTALRPVLREWLALQTNRTGWGQDAPWWYNERASLSQFIGAVWRAGGWALEEYVASKKVKLDDGRFVYSDRAADGEATGRSRGRVDAAIEIKRFRVVLEAKQLWWTGAGDNPGVFREAIEQKLAQAHEQVMAYPNGANRYERYGLVFVVPSFPKSASAETITSHVDSLVAAVNAEQDWFCAWAFPAETRRLLSRTKRRYPGILLVAQAAPSAE
jgi:hypothetical protein